MTQLLVKIKSFIIPLQVIPFLEAGQNLKSLHHL